MSKRKKVFIDIIYDILPEVDEEIELSNRYSKELKTEYIKSTLASIDLSNHHKIYHLYNEISDLLEDKECLYYSNKFNRLLNIEEIPFDIKSNDVVCIKDLLENDIRLLLTQNTPIYYLPVGLQEKIIWLYKYYKKSAESFTIRDIHSILEILESNTSNDYALYPFSFYDDRGKYCEVEVMDEIPNYVFDKIDKQYFSDDYDEGDTLNFTDGLGNEVEFAMGNIRMAYENIIIFPTATYCLKKCQLEDSKIITSTLSFDSENPLFIITNFQELFPTNRKDFILEGEKIVQLL